MQLQSFIDIVMDRQGMTVIDVFQLPLAEPYVVFLRNCTVLENLTDGDGSLEYMKEIPGVLFAPRKVNNSFRFNTSHGHPAYPLPDFAVVLAAMSHTKGVDQGCGRKTNRVRNNAGFL